MVLIPAGEFLRGAAEGAQGDDIPQRVIKLSAFVIDRDEVTVDRYRRCVDRGACLSPAGPEARALDKSLSRGPDDAVLEARKECNGGRDDRQDHPVNCVTLRQAWNYCRWTGKRLPSEAEWEKAARGTGQRRYPWGDAAPTCERATHYRGEHSADLSFRGQPPMPLDEETCTRGTAPAAKFTDSASPYGARQMAGNVAEWVSDWYGPGYYPVSPILDPHGPPQQLDMQGEGRSKAVVRGGSWASDPLALQVTARAAYDPELIHSTIGFRCAASRPIAPTED